MAAASIDELTGVTVTAQKIAVIKSGNAAEEAETKTHLQRMSAINVGESKKLLAAQKAIALSEAVVLGFKAIQGAIAAPPYFPYNLGNVALTTAEVVGNIAGIKGAAHGGLTNVPSESTYLLQKGERVLSPNQNQDFTDMVKNGGTTSQQPVNITIQAVDTSGFEELLYNNRGMISNLIGGMNNEAGEAAVV